MRRRYYIDSPCVTVRGKPSAQLAEKLEKDEKARIAAQVERLGPEGIAAKKELLEKSMEANDAPIPKQVLTDFPVPPVSSISWIPVQSYQDRSDLDSSDALNRRGHSQLKAHIDADGSKLPFFVQYDHVEVCYNLLLPMPSSCKPFRQSDFVSITAIMSLKTVPNHLRQ